MTGWLRLNAMRRDRSKRCFKLDKGALSLLIMSGRGKAIVTEFTERLR